MGWRVEEYDNAISERGIRVLDDSGRTVASDEPYYAQPITAEHAATIVAAVNGRAELVEALEAMAKEFRQLDLPYGSHAYLLATTAITNAKATP